MGSLPIITISRQFGSGGRNIGLELAQRLSIPYYDNQLISLAAEESGFDRRLFEQADKDASNSLLFSLSMYSQASGSYTMPLGDKVFLIQSDIIKKVAANGPCVIVGRCADYVLRESPQHLRVFLQAPLDWRIAYAVEHYGLAVESAKDFIRSVDKKRGVYYKHFTGERWGDSSLYDAVLNTSAVGIEGGIELLEVMTKYFHGIGRF